MQATPRPGEIFSCHELRCWRCFYIKRPEGVAPSLSCLPVLTFVFAISLSPSDTLLPELCHFCFPSHSFSLQIPSFTNMKVFTVLSALSLVAAAAAQQTTHTSTLASSTLSSSTSASLSPEQSCLANCKLQAPSCLSEAAKT
jgi:hypothetical protein